MPHGQMTGIFPVKFRFVYASSCPDAFLNVSPKIAVDFKMRNIHSNYYGICVNVRIDSVTKLS